MLTSECTNVFRSILLIIAIIINISGHKVMPDNDKTKLSLAFIRIPLSFIISRCSVEGVHWFTLLAVL